MCSIVPIFDQVVKLEPQAQAHFFYTKASRVASSRKAGKGKPLTAVASLMSKSWVEVPEFADFSSLCCQECGILKNPRLKLVEFWSHGQRSYLALERHTWDDLGIAGITPRLEKVGKGVHSIGATDRNPRFFVRLATKQVWISIQDIPRGKRQRDSHWRPDCGTNDLGRRVGAIGCWDVVFFTVRWY